MTVSSISLLTLAGCADDATRDTVGAEIGETSGDGDGDPTGDGDPVETCEDGVQNQDETDIDCGGTICGTCADGAACNVGEDCIGLRRRRRLLGRRGLHGRRVCRSHGWGDLL